MKQSIATRALPLALLVAAASAWAQVQSAGEPTPLFAFPPSEAGPVVAPVPADAPEAVAVCASCHLPSGNGRPDNAALAGLPRAYILAQMERYRAGTRKSAVPDYLPAEMMQQIGKGTSPADAALAAEHYSKLPFRSFVRVVEAATIPKAQPSASVYRRDPAGGTEPLGDRIIEMPDDFAGFESGDSEAGYTAYVPAGSIARGEAVARGVGMDEAFACTACHGGRLQGSGDVPAIAGRSPTATFRQLYNFKKGARSGGDAELMRQAAVELSIRDMIAVSAYAASLRP